MPLNYLGHSTTQKFQRYLVGRYTQLDCIVLDANNRAANSAVGNYPIAVLKFTEHLLRTPLTALRRGNQ